MAFVDGYEMMTRNDWIEVLRKKFVEGSTPDYTRDQSILLDQQDIFSMHYTRDIDGVSHRITNVALKRDGKFWRFQNNRVPI